MKSLTFPFKKNIMIKYFRVPSIFKTKENPVNHRSLANSQKKMCGNIFITNIHEEKSKGKANDIHNKPYLQAKN